MNNYPAHIQPLSIDRLPAQPRSIDRPPVQPRSGDWTPAVGEASAVGASETHVVRPPKCEPRSGGRRIAHYIPFTADAVPVLVVSHPVGYARSARFTHGWGPIAASRLFSIIIVLVLSLLSMGSSSLWAQQQKLNAIQQKQLQLYQYINEMNKQHKSNPKLFFQQYNALIVQSCQALAQENQKLAAKTQEMAEKLADQGQQQRGQRLSAAAGFYHKMAQFLMEMNDAYQKTNVGGFKKSLDSYLKCENDLRTNGFQIVPRPWFSDQECVFYLRSSRK